MPFFETLSFHVDEGSGSGFGLLPVNSGPLVLLSENGNLQTFSIGNFAILFTSSALGINSADNGTYSCVVVDMDGFIVTVITIDIRVLGEEHGWELLRVITPLHSNWPHFAQSILLFQRSPVQFCHQRLGSF